MRVRYFAATDLVEALYRGLADNSVAQIIDNLLRADLAIIDELGFAPLDLAGTQLLFQSRELLDLHGSIAVATKRRTCNFNP
jgi:DNA replication protein DnaC